jgi:hypothetical protein
MELTLSYPAPSGLRNEPGRRVLYFAPNLAREAVAFDAALRQPLRFREAMSALHDVVISDLRFKPRDRSAYQRWQAAERESQMRLRRQAVAQAREKIAARANQPLPAGLETAHRDAVEDYWTARRHYGNYLWRHDRAMWRLLMPADPVVTVAEDVVFFECFSADESSYGCLTVGRGETFAGAERAELGTTNVDYSWALYHHFQSLRSYRQTRFQMDPEGFAVATDQAAGHREEKIDLPGGWLRGFLQLQAAMAMPMRRVELSREAVYSLLAWLKRHKADRSPRAVRFELKDGQPPVLALEPWELRITSHRTRYRGPEGPVRVWGRRRLISLARVLPLAERFDVYLLGDGLPSFWVARMGEMRLTLGLSGWTTNDWTRGSALDALAPPAEASASTIARVADFLETERAAAFGRIRLTHALDAAECAATLNRLANTGEVIYDLSAGLYRWRRILPNRIGEADLGAENPEQVEARQLVARRTVKIESDRPQDDGTRLLTGKVASKPVELLLDADGAMRRGQCVCGHHQRAGLRMGPCRHLLALRAAWLTHAAAGDVTDRAAALRAWFNRLQQWAG